MNLNVFNTEKFNIIQDEENYYFFRALNMADNDDIEQGISVSKDGKIERIRTDRERYNGQAKYNENSEISLEEVYDHIKMHYRKDTNCISLTSNSNVAVNYGRGSYKDRYVMIKVPKKEFGEKTVSAPQYMLKELYSRIEQKVENLPEKEKHEILNVFDNIEEATESKTLQEIIAKRYTTKTGELNSNKAHLRKSIAYSSPNARISSYQALDEEQLLEVNKVYAKLAILENEDILKHVIPHSSNSKLRETIGNAFSSTEVIHYGDIKQENIIEIPKEIVDIFALVQQVNGIDPNKVEELKQAIIIAMQSGKQIPQIPEITSQVKDNISIEEMYKLTEGKVEYGKANSIVKNMFYLSKARQNAIALSNILTELLGNNSGFNDVINHIRNNGFRVEPEIISRKSGKGVKLSESVNLNLQKEEQSLVDEIKKLSSKELETVLQNGGLYNAENIITRTFSDAQENEKIDKSRYYAEAIIAKYNWQDIGIEEIKIAERNELIARLQERNCVEIYERLRESGIEEDRIPTILLNIAMREGFYKQYEDGNLEQLLNQREDVLQNNINIEVVERFLGYYDIENTGIRLKDYQQRANHNINRIFEDHKFAQVILPTGAGKSFVALAQMQKYATEHPKEKMLYLAPQDEILNQIKNYIVKYVHGKQGTVGKTEDEIIAETFPNITFETYSGLLAKRGQKAIKDQYGMIVLDELHRTGAKEWEGKVDTLLENQTDNVKVLGITATPTRDVDGRDMANETAKKLGYTDEEIKQRKHLASNMTLENAIKMGYVVNPKLVYCKYDLISSGKMDELRAKIDDIEDEAKRVEELQKYNELREKLNKEIDYEIGEGARKKLEEDARRNLDSGIGKEEILRQNVKKGGKYIVFIPVSDQGDIEDEDGNRIGTKTGEDKIKAYQEYLNKVFEGTDIVPQCHAMSGSWNGKEKNKSGEDKNQQELDAFESDNSDKTKFMVVMNKANEGLHIEGVDGIIWFRALDENSRILYLQQLGRAIYAIDEDDPLPDDKRPTVIDLANNSLTVKIDKEFENSNPIDDLEALTIVTEWINEHDGILPDRNSSNKQEQHYYAVLRRIQNKYSKYLDGFDNFEDLTEEDKSRIGETIEIATEIDLWDIDLPPIPKTRENNEEINPFEIKGILKNFVDMEDEINGIQKESAMSVFVGVCEALAKQGFEFRNFLYTKTVSQDGEKKSLDKTLQDIQEEYPDIDMSQILSLTHQKLDYSIGNAKREAVSVISGHGKCTLTSYQKERLIELGVISLEKESPMTEFTRVCTTLASYGLDFRSFKFMKKGKNKTIADIAIEFPDIDVDKVCEETGIDKSYNLGNKKHYAVKDAKKEKSVMTKDEKQKLVELGVIDLEKENSMTEFVRVCTVLANYGVDFHDFKFTKSINKKSANKTLADIALEFPSIDMDKVCEEASVNIDYPIAQKRSTALGAIKGYGNVRISETERQDLVELGVISLEKESSMSEFTRVCMALSKQGIDFSNFRFGKRVGERTIGKRLGDIALEFPDIDINKICKETGVDIDYPIGKNKYIAAGILKGSKSADDRIMEEEDKIKLLKIGVISLEEESLISEFVRVCVSLANQGMNFRKFKFTKNIDKKAVGKTLEDIALEFPDIDINKVCDETGVDINYSIGQRKQMAVTVISGTRTGNITDYEKKKLIQLGVVSLEKESSMSEFTRVCGALNEQGMDFTKFKFMEKGKKKTLGDIALEFPNIDINKICEDTCVDIDYPIGRKKATAIGIMSGTATGTLTDEEKDILLELGVINLKKNKLEEAKQKRDEAKVKNDKAKELEIQVTEQLKKRGKNHEEQ